MAAKDCTAIDVLILRIAKSVVHDLRPVALAGADGRCAAPDFCAFGRAYNMGDVGIQRIVEHDELFYSMGFQVAEAGIIDLSPGSTLSSVILGFGNVSPLGYSTRWR